MTHSSRSDGVTCALERFLVHGAESPSELPPVEALERSGLAAYAASYFGSERLRPALLAASARHLAIRVEVRRLMQAWKKEGIEALLFKGFHLAEFVYPTPGERQYSDVDVLIEPRQGLRASDVASRHGWVETWSAQRRPTAHDARGARYRGHEVLQLLHPHVGIQLDVHRRLVHNNHNRIDRIARQKRITRLVWEMSQKVDWDGVSLRLPHPLDAVLVGLVLNRCWSPEDFELRSHDYLDFRFLVEKYRLRLPQLQERAEQLGCPRTLEVFLHRCDPFRRRCVLSAPARLELQRWNLLVAAERGNRYLERSWVAALQWPNEVIAVIRQLPGVIATLSAVRQSAGIRGAAEDLAARIDRPRKLDAEEWRRMRQAVHRGLRLLGHGKPILRLPATERDIEALALFAALRRRSCPATLTWRTASGRDGGPQLEVDGTPLTSAGTLLNSKAQGAYRRRRTGKRELAG